MKRFFFAILLIMQSVALYAQFPRPSFELGIGVEITKFSGTLPSYYNNGFRDTISQLVPVYSLIGSLNIPLKMVREKLYLGLNPNVTLGYNSSSIETTVPVYLTLKYGAGSTKESDSRVGFGIGAGGYFSAFSTYLADYISGYLVRYSSTYIAPSAMAEFTFDTRRGLYQIRADFTPVSIQKSGKFIGNISQFNIRLVRTF